MSDNLWHQINAVLGSLTVIIGLWLLLGALPIPLGIGLTIMLAMALAWKCPSMGYIWAIATLLLGMESIAWPLMQMADLKKTRSGTSLGRITKNFHGRAIWPFFRSVLDDFCLWNFQTNPGGYYPRIVFPI